MTASITNAGTLTPAERRGWTRTLLSSGAAGGLLWLGVSYMQVVTRDGFDLTRHALSSLTLGDLGWLQVANFVVSGLLTIACAVGIRQALRPGRAGAWGPILIGAYGVGMVGGGIFVPDPALSWPPGATAGIPALSTGAILHIVFALVAFQSLIVAGIVFARRFAGQSRPGWAAYSAATSVVTFAVTTLPWSEETASLRFAAGDLVITVWLIALTWRLRADST
jgi:hypothetical protein